MTLSELVARWAQIKPDAAAYAWGDSVLTWQGYHDLADQVAAVLAGRLSMGERALVFLPDSGPVHAAYLGCERAGVVAVGVGWRAGRRELEYLCAKTGASLVLTTDTTPLGSADEVGAACALPVVRIDALDECAAADTSRAIGLTDLWLLNSTSGTTGLPKCVMQTQGRWMFFHEKATEFGELTADDVFMSVVPAPFGFGLWTAHVSPTLLGVPCLVQPRFDAALAAEQIERYGVTVLAAVSSQFVMILDAAGDRDLSSLRVLFTGGESISAVRAREFEQRTGCRVLNFYGSNETGMLSGTRVDDPLERRLTTGGRVVPEMQVRLYDLDGNRIPGDRGEGRPACKGPALSPGYFDDPAANAELFTADGWMFMGDVVRIDDDGWLTVLARTADFIIRGGKNISAPAVEEEVATHPAVSLAAVVAVPDDRLGERVGVFVELKPGLSLDLPALVAHLDARGVSREWWPEYVWVLPELPRSSGGKVAKSELREQARLSHSMLTKSSPIADNCNGA